jgi:tetratricopeptide (TPR) repeat protein
MPAQAAAQGAGCAPLHSCSLREAAALLGISRGVISALIAEGFVSPERGPRSEYRFGFQDLVLLRTARALQAAQVPSQRILRSLKQLREQLPRDMPLSGLRLGAIGREVVVRDAGAPWQVQSGQRVFDFDSPAAGPAAAAAPTPIRPAGDRVAAGRVDWFARGVELEGGRPREAEAAYRRAIEAQPACVDAYLNLGVLLSEDGRHDEALALYRRALAFCAHEPLLHFNLGVALEDTQQPEAAIAAYENAMALDPALADAHFNTARLADRLGRARLAIRHYSAYRRLSGVKGRR